MASLAPVVRPNVVPNIRPQVSVTDFPPPSQGTQDPNQGRTILTGSEGQVIDLSYNHSRSMTKNRTKEEKRKYDIVRIYKVTPSGGAAAATRDTTGTIDRNTYVDVEMPHQIQMRERGSKGPLRTDNYRKPKAEDYPNGNVEILEEDLVRENKE
jgi:hypothetical protein